MFINHVPKRIVIFLIYSASEYKNIAVGHPISSPIIIHYVYARGKSSYYNCPVRAYLN